MAYFPTTTHSTKLSDIGRSKLKPFPFFGSLKGGHRTFLKCIIRLSAVSCPVVKSNGNDSG